METWPRSNKTFVPEARVKEVQHGVLGAADIQIDASRVSVLRHPVLLGFFADGRVWILVIAVAEVSTQQDPPHWGMVFVSRVTPSPRSTQSVALESNGSGVPVGL